MVRSGWAQVVFPSYEVLSQGLKDTNPDLVWIDCEVLPGTAFSVPRTQQELYEWEMSKLSKLIVFVQEAATNEAAAKRCPVSTAYAAILVASMEVDMQSSFAYLDVAQ